MKTTCSQCASFQFNLIYDTLFELGQSVLQSRHDDLSLRVSPVRVGVTNACGVKCSLEALVSRAQITLNCYIFLFSRIQIKKAVIGIRDWSCPLRDKSKSPIIFRDVPDKSGRLATLLAPPIYHI